MNAFEKQRAVATKRIVAPNGTAQTVDYGPSAGAMADILEDAKPKTAQATVNAKAAMERVAEMVGLMRIAEERLAEAEERVKREKAALFRIASEDLPELLRESGFEKLTLSDGTTVTVEDQISCSISADRAPEAHAWLRSNNYGGVIKTGVLTSFGKDEVSKADALYLQLVKKYGADHAELKESVHPSTLKALIRELLGKGVKVPLPLFGVHPYTMAKLSVARRKGSV